MVEINQKMEKVFSTESYKRIYDVAKRIVNHTALIDDCVIYDEDIDKKTDLYTKDMLEIYGNSKIGLEYGCSELWIDLKEVNRSQIPLFLFILDMEFSKKYSRKMVFYITYCSGKYSHLDLRFHTYGEDGEMWLDEDLNAYKNNAIIRYVS